MLQTKPTEHLAGITIQGDYKDFYELVESIYRITGLDDDQTMIYDTLLWAIEILFWKIMECERTL